MTCELSSLLSRSCTVIKREASSWWIADSFVKKAEMLSPSFSRLSSSSLRVRIDLIRTVFYVDAEITFLMSRSRS
jgi:hypothetical protein